MNRAIITGTIDSAFEFDTHRNGEDYFLFYVSCERLSGVIDRIPCLAPEHIIKNSFGMASKITIKGRIYTYNHNRKLVIRVLAEKMHDAKKEDNNYVKINGFLCKTPILRTTPMGRYISDLLIASNHWKNKSDYIPCIAWGENAIFAPNYKVGDRIKLEGRIQSREYIKKISEEYSEQRIAYEVSISKMEVIESEKCKDQVADAE